MLQATLFGIATALLGGLAITVLEGWYHDNWATNIVIRFGDTVFLPLYNALTITAFLEESISTTIIIIGVVGVLASLFFYQLLEEHLEKSDPSGAVFYHEFFVTAQSFYTVVSLLTVPVSLAHLFLLGYFLTFAYAAWQRYATS